MKNLLNNPWVVGALCVIALITVYFRLFSSNSRPPLPEPEKVADLPSSAVQSPAAPVPFSVGNANTPSPTETPAAQPITVGWAETLARDPFQAIRQLKSLGGQDVEEGKNVPREEGKERQSPPSEIRLHAVFLDGPNRVAMINRELVKEGERINGYIVRRIQRDGVQLVGQEETRWLDFSVSPPKVKSGKNNESRTTSSIVKDPVTS